MSVELEKADMEGGVVRGGVGVDSESDKVVRVSSVGVPTQCTGNANGKALRNTLGSDEGHIVSG